ncbi:hypothetical protein D3C81_1700450 [compost metagenome]
MLAEQPLVLIDRAFGIDCPQLGVKQVLVYALKRGSGLVACKAVKGLAEQINLVAQGRGRLLRIIAAEGKISERARCQ